MAKVRIQCDFVGAKGESGRDVSTSISRLAYEIASRGQTWRILEINTLIVRTCALINMIPSPMPRTSQPIL